MRKILFSLAVVLVLAISSVSAYSYYADDNSYTYYEKITPYEHVQQVKEKTPYGTVSTSYRARYDDGYPNRLYGYFNEGPRPGVTIKEYHRTSPYYNDAAYRSSYHDYYYKPVYNGDYYDHSYRAYTYRW